MTDDRDLEAWLGADDPGDTEDPDAALAADDAPDEEIAAWRAFVGASESGGSDAAAPAAGGADAGEDRKSPMDSEPEDAAGPTASDESDEPLEPAASAATGSPAGLDEAELPETRVEEEPIAELPVPEEAPVPQEERLDDTSEFDAVTEATAPVVEGFTFEGPATGEVPIVGARQRRGEEADEPGETGATAGEDVPAEDEGDSLVEAEATWLDAFEDFTAEEYVAAATREHVGLAEAMAKAGAEDAAEQAPLLAPIPGLEQTSVGFEDVVEAGLGVEGLGAESARSDLALRIGSGILLAAAFVASLLWRPALVVLALVVFLLTAAEFYSALLRSGRRPVSLFGFLGLAGIALGTVAWGVVAIPFGVAVTATVLLLFYAVTPQRPHAASGFLLTMLVLLWVGVLGSFAFAIIGADAYRILVLGVVGLVVLIDVAQYFVGRAVGRRPLAPVVSPKKTVEGLVGGILLALAGAAVLGFLEPFDLVSGLALGIVVAVCAPLGDLAVSVVKRSLDVKDMGSIIPGHGGFLDRIDGLIFVVPAAWALLRILGLL